MLAYVCALLRVEWPSRIIPCFFIAIGRGVTDDKGPLVASIFAAAKLKRENKLCMDVVFLVEGAEESGIGRSHRGLDQVVADNRHWFRSPSVSLCCVGFAGVVFVHL